MAQSEPVESGQAVGAGWGVAADLGDPGTVSATLVPAAIATVPAVCPAPPGPCEDDDSEDLLTAQVLGGGLADASALVSEAYAFKDPALSSNPERLADLQTLMGTFSGVTLPTEWNLRGYGAVSDLAIDIDLGLLGVGSITADLVEAEAVSGLRDIGGTPTPVTASGARIDNLRINGVLIPILPTMGPNTDIPTGIAGLTITYWQTNWNPATGTTTDGNPVFVNTLRIVSTIPGASFDIVVARAQASSVTADPPPVAVDDNATTSEDTPVVIDVSANDTGLAGDSSTWTITPSDPANGSVTCTTTSCTYTPDAGYDGPDTFTYTICDADGQCDTATVTVTVTATPVDAVNDSATTPQDTAVVIDVTANDTGLGGNSADWTITPSNPPDGSVSCTTTSCEYTPDPGFHGTDTFTYEVCDADGDCASATVTVTVTAVASDTPPQAINDTATTPQDTTVVIDVTANDQNLDGAPSTWTLTETTGPDNGSVTCAPTTGCEYAPDTGFVGTDTFTYEVCDEDGDCASATVTVEVGGGAPPAAPPQAINDTATTPQNAAVVIDVTANDQNLDGAPSTWTLTAATPPANGSVTCAPTTGCEYTPDTDFEGIDSFTYTVCDEDGECSSATVTVTVTPVATGSPADAFNDSDTTPAGTPVVIDVTANDTGLDGASSQWSITPSNPANGDAVCTTTSCTYTPDPGFTGTDTFTYEVCDADGDCASATVTVTVTAAAPPPPPPPPPGGGGVQPPVAVDDTETAQPGQPVTVPVIDNDSGNLDPSTVTIIDGPSNGTVDCANNGTCTYTPDDGFTGEDDFTYEVCNGSGQCDQATVTIIVPPAIPDTNPPVAEDDNATTRRGTPVAITVIQNDSDPDGDLNTSSVRVIQQPANGSVTCLGGTCTYTPDPGFTGEDSFIYEVCDAEGNCDTATVSVDVRPPAGNGDGPGGSIGEGGSSGGGSGGGGDPDRDGQPSAPTRFSPAPAGPIPGLNPTLGAPNNPALPMTGAEPGFYLALAWNLVLVGGLLLFLDARSRRAAAVSLPATLVGGTDLLERTEPPTEKVQPMTEPVEEAEPVVEPDPIELSVATDKPKPQKAPARKPAAKKTAAAKPPAKKAAATKKPAAAKASTVKKSTVAKRPTSAKKSTVAKKAALTKKSTVAKKKTARGTSTKKSTVKRSTARK